MAQNGQEVLTIRNIDDVKNALGIKGLKNLAVEAFFPELLDLKIEHVFTITRQELDQIKIQCEEIYNRHGKEKVLEHIKMLLQEKYRELGNTRSGLTGIEVSRLNNDVKNNSGQTVKNPKQNPLDGLSESEKTKTQETLDNQQRELETLDVTKPLTREQFSLIGSIKHGLTDAVTTISMTGTSTKEYLLEGDFKDILEKYGNHLNQYQKGCLQKLQEIKENGTEELKNELLNNWSTYVENGFKIGSVAGNVIRNDDSPETKGFIEAVKKHPIIAGVGAILGLFGIYKIGKFFFGGSEENENSEKSKKSEKKGFFRTILDYILPEKYQKLGLIGLISFAIMGGTGKILGFEGAKKFMKEKFGLDIDENRFLKFLELMGKMKPIDAFIALFWGADAVNEAKESNEFYESLTGKLNADLKADSKLKGKLQNGFDKDIVKKVGGMNAKSFFEFGWDDAFSLMGTFAKGIIGGNDKEKAQMKTLRDLLKKKMRTKKYKYADDSTVEDVYKKLYPEIPSSTGTGSTETQTQSTNEQSDSSSTAQTVVAGTGATAVTSVGSNLDSSDDSPEEGEGQSEIREEEKKSFYEGFDERSMGNPVLYYYSKGVRYAVSSNILNYQLTKYIVEKGTKGATKPEVKAEIAELEKVKGLLEKGNLTQEEKVQLRDGLEKIKQKNPNLFSKIRGQKIDFSRDIPDEKVRKQVEDRVRKLQADLENYNEKMMGLKKRKLELAIEGEKQLQGLKNKKLTEYNLKREQYLRQIEAIDKEMIELNKKVGPEFNKSVTETTDLLKKYSLPEKKILGKVGNTLLGLGAYIPGSKLAGKGMKLGLIGFASHTVLMEGMTGDEKFAGDAVELVGGFIPGVSEFLDFKAALSGKDHAGRDLSSRDRLIRGAFGVVGVFTLGAGTLLKGAVKGVAKVAGKGASKGATKGVSASTVRNLKFANHAGRITSKVLSFASLGIVIHDCWEDITGFVADSKVGQLARQATESLRN